jgi:hypothetical protein
MLRWLLLLNVLFATFAMAVPYRLELNAPWPDNTVWGGIMLVVTNFVLVPSIVLFLIWNRFDVAGVLTLMCLVSSAYHACRAGFVCFERFRDAQIYDHLLVYATLLWIIMYGIVRDEWFDDGRVSPVRKLRVQAGLFFLFVGPALGLVLDNPESGTVRVFGFVLPVTLAVLSAVITRTPLFYRARYGWAGIVLFGVAVVFYSLCPHSWYEEAHSLWHVTSMVAVPLVQIGFDRDLWRNNP